VLRDRNVQRRENCGVLGWLTNPWDVINGSFLNDLVHSASLRFVSDGIFFLGKLGSTHSRCGNLPADRIVHDEIRDEAENRKWTYDQTPVNCSPIVFLEVSVPDNLYCSNREFF